MSARVVSYVPPPSGLSDTLLAFQAIAGPSVAARIEPDPLGPVNRIVTLLAGERRIKSALCHIPVGAKVVLGRDAGMGGYFSTFGSPGWRALNGLPEVDPEPYRPPGWYIEVNGRRVLTVSDHDMRPPAPPPPRIACHLRAYRSMRRALTEQLRADADAIAAHLGYHRDDECGGDW